MNIIIYRGTHEIGGTLIELKSENSRILIDAGFPLFLNNKPIDTNDIYFQFPYPYDKLITSGASGCISHFKLATLELCHS